MLMSKGNFDLDCCKGNGLAFTLILIGAAYALQHKGVLFGNITLWPWVLIAIGVVTLVHNKA
jgi:hypothetical protein